MYNINCLSWLRCCWTWCYIVWQTGTTVSKSFSTHHPTILWNAVLATDSIIKYTTNTSIHMHTQSSRKMNRECHSPCSQNVPFQPGWQTHTPARHWPCPEQSGTWQSCSGMSHSGPFQPSSQWHSPPPYFPWLEHKTGQTPGPIAKNIQTSRYKHNSFSLLSYHIDLFSPTYHSRLCHRRHSSSSNN
jgi:hypothetical protein